MSLDQCAEIVRRGDPDRFRAVLAAPLAARKVLLPIYACNVEIARAPWASEEPMIAEMRLQWWFDALEEIASGAPVRAHEVTTPLAGVLDGEGARILQASVDARRRDARREDPADLDAATGYLRDTSGALMWASARALGATDEARAWAVGYAQGLANYLVAVPELRAMGRRPWPEMGAGAFREVIEQAMGAARPFRARSRPQRVAELAAWQYPSILRRAYRLPTSVGEGGLVPSEARQRLALLWRGLRL